MGLICDSREELATREELIELIFSNKRIAHVLIGEPGIGKSWMLQQLQRRIGDHAVYVCCSPAASAIAFEPLSVLLRELSDRGLLSLDWLASAQSSDFALINVRDALATASQSGPYEIYIDDLQWADPQSIQALAYCIDRLQDYPIRWFFAAASGNEAVESFVSKLRVRLLLERWPISSLTPAEARAFVRAIDFEPSDDEIEELVLRSGANPFYLQSLATNGGETTLEIRASMRGRIERLASDERRILAALAVSIHSLDAEALSRATSLPMVRLTSALERCKDAGLLRREFLQYTLTHQFARDAALDSVPPKVICDLHRFFAEIEAEPLVRAAHLEAAGLTEAAAEQQFHIALDALSTRKGGACLRACKAVQRLCGPDTTIHRASAGLELIARRVSPFDDAPTVELGRKQLDDAFGNLPLEMRVRCESAYYSAISPFVKDRKTQASALAGFLAQCDASGVRRLGPLYRMLAKLQYGAGMMAAAQASFERAMGKVRDDYDVVTALRIRIELGLTHAALGDSVAAVELIEGAVTEAATRGLTGEVLSGCAAAMYVTSLAGRHEESLKWGTFALAHPGPKSPAWMAVILYDIADIDLAQGYPERALGRLAAFRERVASLSADEQAMLAVMEATALLYLNRFTEASESIEAAMRSMAAAESWTRVALRSVKALLLELTGDFAGALEHAQFVMRYASIEGNCAQFRLAATVQVARLLYRKEADSFDDARSTCEALMQRTPHAEIALEYVNAYERLSHEKSRDNARLLEAVTRRDPQRFSRSLNALEAAHAAGDTKALTEVLAEFDAIGSRAIAAPIRELLHPAASPAVLRVRRRKLLSSREVELARYVASGATNAEIAKLLGLSRKTVDNHVSNILSKCGVRSRVEIASLVIRGEVPAG